MRNRRPVRALRDPRRHALRPGSLEFLEDRRLLTGGTNLLGSALSGGSGLATFKNLQPVPITVGEGRATTVPVAFLQGLDSGAATASYTVSVDWGNGLTSVGTTAREGSSGLLLTATTPAFASSGTRSVTVTLTDSRSPSLPRVLSTSATVEPTGDILTPTLGSTPLVQGTSFSGRVATFRDETGQGPPANKEITIVWGDGLTDRSAEVRLGDVVTETDSSGQTHRVAVYDIYSSHLYSTPGIQVATITTTGADGPHSASTAVPVLASPRLLVPVPSVFSAGTSSRQLVGTFLGSSPTSTIGDYQATVAWSTGGGDSISIVPAEITSDPGGGFNVWATAKFPASGSVPLTVTVIETDEASAQVVAKATVNPANVTAQGSQITAIELQSFPTPIARFTSSNPLATVSDYNVAVDWGDGSVGSIGWTSLGNGQFAVSGNHSYLQPGTYTVSTAIGAPTLDGSWVLVGQTTSTVTVQPQPIVVRSQSVAATQSLTYNGLVAGFSTLDPRVGAGDFAASIDWGDGYGTSPGTIVRNADGSFGVLGQHLYYEAGQDPVTVTVTRVGVSGPAAQTVTSTGQATVADALPYTEGQSLKGVQGDTITGIVATFRDMTPSAPSAYAAAIDWGDGTHSTGTISSYGGQFVVLGSHAYGAAGTYQPVVTMNEGNAQPFQATATVTVSPRPPVVVPPPVVLPPVVTPPVPPPSIVSARSVVDRRGAIKLFLTYSGTIDPSTASDAGRYVVTAPGRDGKFGTRDDQKIRLTSARFDPGSHVVTLIPKGAFSRRSSFRVSISGGPTMTISSVFAATKGG